LNFIPATLSGVSITPIRRGQAPSPPPIPYCGVPQSPEDKPFLKVSVALAQTGAARLSLDAMPRASFINGKLQTIRDQFEERVQAEFDFGDKRRY
jgi:hypothetical protein